MKKSHAGMGMLLAGLLALGWGLSAQGPATQAAPARQDEAPKVVLGTFDSRAVAVAYARSEAFTERLREMRKELVAANAAGDRKRAGEIEAMGPALQQQIHRQGFGTAPVDDIIAVIEGELPGIAAKAGVDVIVSKWVVAYRAEGARTVDVTRLLVQEFDPDAATLEVVEQVLASEPIPLAELEKHQNH